MLWSSPAFRRRRCLSPHVLQHLKGLLFPSEKILGQKKKVKGGRKEFSAAVKIFSPRRCSAGPAVQWGACRLYLGSSITPLLRSVILGYLTFFWSSSF